MVRLPHFEGGSKASVVGGWNYMISENCPHPEEAVEFIRYMISERPQKLIFLLTSHMPVLRSLYENKELLSSHPQLRLTKEILSEGRQRPDYVNYKSFSDSMLENLRLALEEKISPEEAVANMREAVAAGF